MSEIIKLNASRTMSRKRTMSAEEIEDIAMKYIGEIVKKNASFIDVASVGIALIETSFVIQAQGGILKKTALQDLEGFFNEISKGIKEKYDEYYVKGGVQKK